MLRLAVATTTARAPLRGALVITRRSRSSSSSSLLLPHRALTTSTPLPKPQLQPQQLQLQPPHRDHHHAQQGDAHEREIPLLTTPTHPTGDITRVHGVVSASSVRNRNILVDLWVALRGVMGGSATPYEDLMNEAVVAAANGLAEAAHHLGATHVVNVRIETAVLITRFVIGTHVFVTATGTAVDVVMRDTHHQGKPSSTSSSS